MKPSQKKTDFSLPIIYSKNLTANPFLAPNKTNVELNVPIKKILAEQKYSFLTSDPENKVG